MSKPGSRIWERAADLAEAAPTWSDLRWHRLELVAARRWRLRGRPLPPEIARAEQIAAMGALTAEVLLQRVRDACEGVVIVLKGPEVAALYPDPLLRGYIDVDLLVADPEREQARLLAAGFVESADPPWAFRRTRERDELFVGKHHAHPLLWPGLPMRVELHRRPSWPRWLKPPPVEDLFAALVPSATGIDGVSTLPRLEHALVLAAHMWSHDPLGRLRDLFELVAMAEGTPKADLARVAEKWGIGRLWQSTISTADAVTAGARPTLAQRLWARNLIGVRERTVFESHLEGWISCFWTLRPSEALPLALGNIIWDLRPAAEEPWRAKLRRTRRALSHAAARKSEHDEQLGVEARQLHPPQRWTGRDRASR
jgi:hypothetical protein